MAHVTHRRQKTKREGASNSFEAGATALCLPPRRLLSLSSHLLFTSLSLPLLLFRHLLLRFDLPIHCSRRASFRLPYSTAWTSYPHLSTFHSPPALPIFLCGRVCCQQRVDTVLFFRFSLLVSSDQRSCHHEAQLAGELWNPSRNRVVRICP